MNRKATSTETIVKTYYDCLKARDRKGLLSVIDENILITYHSQPDAFPWSGKFHGIEGFDRFFESLRTHLEIVEVDFLATTSSENRVVKQCEGCWKYIKSGQLVRGFMVNIFTVTDGKITAYDVYADTAAFQAGMEADKQA